MLGRPKGLRAEIRSLLDDWRELVSANLPEARTLLSRTLADRIVFTPRDAEYQITVPIGFDRMIASIPGLGGLQERWRPHRDSNPG